MPVPVPSEEVVDLNWREGVIWALRLLAARDPHDDAEIARCLEDASSAAALKAFVLESVCAGVVPPPGVPIALRPGLGVDMREGVLWAFRLLLKRNPPNEQVVEFHTRAHASADMLRDAFVGCDEYRLQTPGEFGAAVERAGALSDMGVIERFKPYATQRPPEGTFADFLGVVTRCTYLPSAYASWSGTIGGPPGAPNGPMHDLAEWAGTLRSVLEARDQMTVVELGAGWAPWLVAGAVAARKRGIKKLTLVGVEGDEGHVKFSRQHFVDNGLDPDAHRLVHAVVGVADGFATFPKHDDPRSNYGAEADFDKSNGGWGMVRVKCVSLDTLLKDIPIVDVLHCDIQGAEAEVLEAAKDVVDKRIRRIVIGTHSREVEGALLKLFSGMGWALEDDTSCRMKQAANGQIVLIEDGAQVWRNPRLAGTIPD